MNIIIPTLAVPVSNVRANSVKSSMVGYNWVSAVIDKLWIIDL